MSFPSRFGPNILKNSPTCRRANIWTNRKSSAGVPPASLSRDQFDFLLLKNLPASSKPDSPKSEKVAGSGTGNGMTVALKMFTSKPSGSLFEAGIPPDKP